MVDYLTREDVDNFGSDLINFAQRAAAQALSPQLQSIQQQNAELAQRLAQESRHRLDSQVAAAIPTYREIDRDPGWHQYLRTVDPLSGRIRQVLLNDAIQQADAPRVISFFRSYLREGGGSASGQSSATAERSARPSGQRTYTRDQIAQLYAAHRKGHYNGREAEWARLEADVFAAQREGRVLGHPYLTK